MATALVILADGCEEIEVTTIIDVLRRGAVEVTTATIANEQVIGAHKMKLLAETHLNAVASNSFDMVILPGGQPGTDNLLASSEVNTLVTDMSERGAYVAAICAAPLVLSKAGLLKSKRATCYPFYQKDLNCHELVKDEKVVTDGNITTSQGPGTAMHFALRLVEILSGEEKARQVADDLLF
ncbi:MAG: DJ-1/PfpI family protein [Bdellovibrionota bacterium]